MLRRVFARRRRHTPSPIALCLLAVMFAQTEDDVRSAIDLLNQAEKETTP